MAARARAASHRARRRHRADPHDLVITTLVAAGLLGAGTWVAILITALSH
jgi:O-antigen ligase